MALQVTHARSHAQVLSWGLLASLLGCGGGGGGSTPKPVLTITSAPTTTAQEAHPYRYVVNATSPQAGSLQFTLTNGPAGAALSGSTLTWTPDASLVGRTQGFTLRVADGSSTVDQSWSVLVSANGLPAFSSQPPASAKEGHAYVYDLAAVDPDGDGVQFAAIQLPPSASLTGAHLTWTPVASEVGQGAEFKVKALDGFGGIREQVWMLTPTANALPVITSQPPSDVSFVQGLPVFDYALTSTDADNDTISFTLLQAPTGTTLVNGIVHWQPTPAQERVPQTFQVRAADGHGGTTDQLWTKAYSGVLRGGWSEMYQAPSGAVTLVQDATLASWGLTGLVPNGTGGFRTITGALKPDGTFTLPGIPPGGFWVVTHRGYIWTDRGTLDLGKRLLGRADAAPVVDAAPLLVNLTNMDSWSATNNLLWQVPNQAVQILFGSELFSTNAPVSGDTALSSASLSHLAYQPLVEAEKGDSLSLVQFGSAYQGSFYTESIAKSFTTSTLTQTVASGGTIAGAFVEPPAASVDLNWDATQSTPLSTQVRPDAVGDGQSFRVVAQPGGLAHGLLQEKYGDLEQNFSLPILARNHALGLAHFNQPLTFRDPYPATWPRVFHAVNSYVCNQMVNGASALTLGYVATISEATGTAETPLTHLVSPIQHPTINGQDFFTGRSGVGAMPTLSWDPPAQGTAACYQIRIWELMPGDGGYGFGADYGHDLTVFGTSVQIPANILLPGKQYILRVRAVSAGAGYDPSVPNQFPLPLGLADCISGPIQP